MWGTNRLYTHVFETVRARVERGGAGVLEGDGSYYIEQFIPSYGAGDFYAEVRFPRLNALTAHGASAWVCQYNSGGEPGTGATKVIDIDDTETVVADGNLSKNVSGLTIPPPTGGWTMAALNALKMRMGYGTASANPAVMQWNDAMIQAAVADLLPRKRNFPVWI